MVKTAE
jgi:hypothetical protein